MTCGIYLGTPKNGVTDSVYIGQSINIEERVQRHIRDMRNNKHRPKVQEMFNKYGEFEWEILEVCAPERLSTKEKYYINIFNACTQGMNTYEDSSSVPVLCGIHNGKVTPGLLNLYKLILKTTLDNPCLSRNEIASLCNTKYHVVMHVWYGQVPWLENIFPEYRKVQELLGNRQIGGKSAEQKGIKYPEILSPTFISYKVSNVRQFALEHGIDKSDLSNVLNFKKPSVAGWILKDLDILNPLLHTKFMSSNRGYYKKQYTLYKEHCK